MEKLSKLLNEYLESQNKDIQQFMNIAALMTQSDSKLYQTYIISKDFGFIQRLVEQDKINITKSKIDELPAMYAYDYDSVECKTDRLLMILAISEQPIELLCSILK